MVDEQLARRGISDPGVLYAMTSIPRELFVPVQLRDRAYDDGALPVDCRQTISQPYMVGRMTELLGLSDADRVLEIGTGTGYQTAILARIVAHVYTVEWHARLMTQTAERLRSLGINNVSYRCGDGSLGWTERGPFDGIIVTAGAPDVPRTLCEQLVDGGRLVVPIGAENEQTLVLVRRVGEGFRRENVLKCRFVRLLGAEGWGA